ncbi:MAG TPA: CBS domain-containing protein [Burkholderiaceae bacterium]
MNVSSIAHQRLVCVDLNATPHEAALAMRTHHVGTVVVVTTEAGVRHACGILTDRDLAVEVLARDTDASQSHVGEYASTQLVCVRGSADLGEAVAAMHQHGVRRLLVTGTRGDVVGILSSDDLLETMAMQLVGLAAALREGVSREATERPPAGEAQAGPLFLPLGTPGLQMPHDDD